MNFHRPHFFAGGTRWLGLSLVLLVLSGVAHAQPTEPGRWLLVFDTSVTMKKRLPATAEALKHFLAASADGQIQSGDSMAVWTYGRQLTAGQFPVVDWQSERATALGSNLVSFLRLQRYTNDSSFTPLQASLNRVIANSERLTIVIFCDGLSPMNFTPYDEGINQNFLDGQSERKKTQQPFVVVLRSQLGKFVGCTVNFPPGHINLPPFPALPPPPPPPPSVSATVHAPGIVAPPAAVPDLVIVGKKVGTNDTVAAEATPPPVKPVTIVTNQAVVATPVVPSPVKVAPAPVPPSPANIVPVTNLSPVAIPVIPLPTRVVVTQVVAQPVTPIVTQTSTPVVAAPVGTNAAPIVAQVVNDGHARIFVFIGIGLLAVAVGLVLVIVRAGRRPHASLITSTMNDDSHRK